MIAFKLHLEASTCFEICMSIIQPTEKQRQELTKEATVFIS